MTHFATRRAAGSPCGPVRTLAGVCSAWWSARRGRRHPAGAHAWAVGQMRRLHCDARPGVAPRNSLRDLRSLRSSQRGESVHEARCARRPQRWPCRPRQARGPGRSPGTNSPPDCSGPGSPSRRPRNRRRRVPPAAMHRTGAAQRCGCALGVPREAAAVAQRASLVAVTSQRSFKVANGPAAVRRLSRAPGTLRAPSLVAWRSSTAGSPRCR
jgi:hypothetical protein